MTPTITFSVAAGWLFRGEWEPLLLLGRDVAAKGRSEVLNIVTFPADSTDAVIDAIQSQEILEYTDPDSASIGGIEGLSFTVDVIVPGGELVELFVFPNNRLYNQVPFNPPTFGDGDRIRFTMIPVGGGVVTIMAISRGGIDFDGFLDTVDEVLATVSFGESGTG